WQVFPHPCTRHFASLDFRIGHLYGYDQLLKLGKERKDVIFLDIGCCYTSISAFIHNPNAGVYRIVNRKRHTIRRKRWLPCEADCCI
ncbi:hypothetical protein C8Q73DRAFT_654598, partial [Cubamyces lactineus]